MGGKITEPVQVELVNPVAEITYQNNVKIYADDIIYQIQMRWYYDGKMKMVYISLEKSIIRNIEDKCMSNGEIRLFLKLICGRILKSLNP